MIGVLTTVTSMGTLKVPANQQIPLLVYFAEW
jgi:hypothetical protein